MILRALDSTIDIASRYTKTSHVRMRAMADALLKVDGEGISGDIVECGVWRGGNIILARKLSPRRTCWLFDTFAGMTLPEDVDVTRSGKKAIDSYNGKMKPGGKWAAVPVAEVQDNLRECGVFDEDVLRFVEGPVEKTLVDNKNLPSSISILRLDTDWYSSTKIELEVLYPRLASGGVLIIDDYGHWMGAAKAVLEYFGEEIVSSLRPIDYTAVAMTKP